MININIKTFILSILLLFLSSIFCIIGAPCVKAGLWEDQIGVGTDPGQIGESFGYVDEPNSLMVFLAKLIKFFLGFLGIIFLVLIILAGYKWMASQGSEEHINKAKSQLKSSVIGLVIIIMAYAITFYITKYLYEVAT